MKRLQAVSSLPLSHCIHVLYDTTSLGLLSIPSVSGILMGVVALMRECDEMSWSDFTIHCCEIVELFSYFCTAAIYIFYSRELEDQNVGTNTT